MAFLWDSALHTFRKIDFVRPMIFKTMHNVLVSHLPGHICKIHVPCLSGFRLQMIPLHLHPSWAFAWLHLLTSKKCPFRDVPATEALGDARTYLPLVEEETCSLGTVDADCTILDSGVALEGLLHSPEEAVRRVLGAAMIVHVPSPQVVHTVAGLLEEEACPFSDMSHHLLLLFQRSVRN